MQDNLTVTAGSSRGKGRPTIDEVEAIARDLGFASGQEYLLELSRLHMAGHIHVPSARKLTGGGRYPPRVALTRSKGKVFQGDSAILMKETLEPASVDLVMTSPPFGLLKKKPYGNEDADEYLDWFDQFAEGFHRVLKPQGSLVIDIGGAYQRGRPTRSLYHFELVIRLCRAHGFFLAQEFFWWNPAKLPLPAEWVNIRRVRVRDSVNMVFWLSKTPYPKASNRRVLQRYSESMRRLHARGSYNAGIRPGGQDISDKGFLHDHGGSIPHNLIALANTESTTAYQQYCRENGIQAHPARFPGGLPAFFIRMVTDPGDLVLDPFAGSCVTGQVAEAMDRRWICCELQQEYIDGARGRFLERSDDGGPEPRRSKPYEAYPPNLSIWSEEESPLVKDGGSSRPTRESQKGD